MNAKLFKTLTTTLAVVLLAGTLVEPAHAQGLVDFEALRLNLFIPFEGDSFFTALLGILNFVLLIGGLIAFFFVLYGGFVYLLAGGDAAKAGQGRQIIVNAVIGIIIIFLSLALVRFVISRTDQDRLELDVSYLQQR